MKLEDFILNELKGSIMLTGKKGSGKTLSATLIAYILYKHGWKIYANYHLNFDYTAIDKLSVIQNAQEGLLIVDEAYQWLDSRRSSSSKNVLITTLLAKARKNKIRVLLLAQYAITIDLRYRIDADWWIQTYIYDVKSLEDGTLIPTALLWEVYTRDAIGEWEEYGQFVIKIPQWLLELYDTNADIFSIEDDVNVKQKKEKTSKKRKKKKSKR